MEIWTVPTGSWRRSAHLPRLLSAQGPLGGRGWRLWEWRVERSLEGERSVSQPILACCVMVMWLALSEPAPQHGGVWWASLADVRPSPPVLCEAEAAVQPGAEGASGTGD